MEFERIDLVVVLVAEVDVRSELVDDLVIVIRLRRLARALIGLQRVSQGVPVERARRVGNLIVVVKNHRTTHALTRRREGNVRVVH